ncbi:hypothetical protein A2U01_0033082, partial [Trifolium medium]|nr:hypothetical protein [Trifolium medium]
MIGNGEDSLWAWQWNEELSVSEEQQLEELKELLAEALNPYVVAAIKKLWRNDVPSK